MRGTHVVVRIGVVSFIAVFLFLDAPAVGAQEASVRTLDLYVYDRDLEIPLEGVTVREAGTGNQSTTDAEGRVELTVSSRSPRTVLTLRLFGYENVRTMVTEFDGTIAIPMVIMGVLEAQELVIVADRIGRTDDEAGVSIVVERDFIKSSAMIGVIEDVMSTVKLLPGVAYTGGFNSYLSVRGGEPDGLTHVLDGLVVKYPYHWGGGVSVFNPHVVESVKLSAGIFPVRYGQATSGLMEVFTIDPVNGLRWEVAQSTSTLEGYVQVPFGEKYGLFAGSRLTNYDLVFAMTGQFLEEQGVTLSRVPYIYAGYLRWYGRPSPETEWFVNGTVGTDGIGVAAIEPDVDESEAIRNTFDFRWRNYDVLTGVGARRLLGDRVLVSGVAGYEYVRNVVDANFTERGTRTYSDRFVEEVHEKPEFAPYRPFVSAGDSFSIDQPNGFFNANILHHTQLRGDVDYYLNDANTFQSGAGVFVPVNEYAADFSFWSTTEDQESGEIRSVRRTIDQSAPSNRTLVSFAYTNWKREFVPDLLSADIGLRADHAVLYGEGFRLNTLPALGPRALVRWTPVVDAPFEEMTTTVGSGIFTKVPFDAQLINEELGLKDFELAAPKSAMALLGWEARFTEGYRFKIEGYYKYLYDRFYINFEDEARPGDRVEVMPAVYTDGVGHVGGFDLVLDRRTSRWFDGMISYSFIYARYKNPQGGDDDGGPSEPRGRWYYPSFHRLHTFNASVNVKPRDWFTLTTTVSFASGAPSPGYGDKRTVPVFITDAREQSRLNVAETYEREQYYVDGNRDGWVLPLDVRASFHNYGRGGKVYREFYVGAEDLLAPLLSRIAPATDAVRTDRYTGEDTRAAEQNVSFPIVSIGLRLSY